MVTKVIWIIVSVVIFIIGFSLWHKIREPIVRKAWKNPKPSSWKEWLFVIITIVIIVLIILWAKFSLFAGG